MRILTYFILFVFLLSCKDDPPVVVQGGLNVNCTVMHHTYPVPGARVYVKDGTTAWPGHDTALYDRSLPAGPDGKVVFEDLGGGAHVFYAIAWDTAVMDSVNGYMSVNAILDPGETKTLDLVIPVSE